MAQEQPELVGPRVCGHCGVLVQMQVAAWHDTPPPEEEAEMDFYDQAMTLRHRILECLSCRKKTLTQYYWNQPRNDYGTTTEEVVLYPVDAAVPAGLPAGIEKLYRASRKVKHVDADSYVTKVRKLLETACVHAGAKSGNLEGRIDKLLKMGKIPPALASAAHKLRFFGNKGAHASDDDVPKEAIPIVEKLCDALLGYIYSMPLLIEDAETLLKALDAPNAPIQPQQP